MSVSLGTFVCLSVARRTLRILFHCFGGRCRLSWYHKLLNWGPHGTVSGNEIVFQEVSRTPQLSASARCFDQCCHRLRRCSGLIMPCRPCCGHSGQHKIKKVSKTTQTNTQGKQRSPPSYHLKKQKKNELLRPMALLFSLRLFFSFDLFDCVFVVVCPIPWTWILSACGSYRYDF